MACKDNNIVSNIINRVGPEIYGSPCNSELEALKLLIVVAYFI